MSHPPICRGQNDRFSFHGPIRRVCSRVSGSVSGAVSGMRERPQRSQLVGGPERSEANAFLNRWESSWGVSLRTRTVRAACLHSSFDALASNHGSMPAVGGDILIGWITRTFLLRILGVFESLEYRIVTLPPESVLERRWLHGRFPFQQRLRPFQQLFLGRTATRAYLIGPRCVQHPTQTDLPKRYPP